MPPHPAPRNGKLASAAISTPGMSAPQPAAVLSRNTATSNSPVSDPVHPLFSGNASGVQTHNPLIFPLFPLDSCKFLSKLVSPPQKTLNFAHQNLRKPQQNPTSSTLVKPDFFWCPPGHPILNPLKKRLFISFIKSMLRKLKTPQNRPPRAAFLPVSAPCGGPCSLVAALPRRWNSRPGLES
jgi:hypothetical protein